LNARIQKFNDPDEKETCREGTAKRWIVRQILPPALCDGSMKVLALECWRIKKLIPEFAANRKHLVLQTSVDKMIDALAALGVAIDDPQGSEFKDGMTLNVAYLITPTNWK
jgi:hypothetical protein